MWYFLLKCILLQCFDWVNLWWLADLSFLARCIFWIFLSFLLSWNFLHFAFFFLILVFAFKSSFLFKFFDPPVGPNFDTKLPMFFYPSPTSRNKKEVIHIQYDVTQPVLISLIEFPGRLQSIVDVPNTSSWTKTNGQILLSFSPIKSTFLKISWTLSFRTRYLQMHDWIM